MDNSAVTPNNESRGHQVVTFQIAVNGTAEIWSERKISYDELVKLAFPNGPFGPTIRYSITVTWPDGREDGLRRNQSVHVEDGMSFDVRNTDKS